MSDLLDAALKYADLGLWIFPLRKILTLPDGSKACTCKAGAGCPSIGKHPATKWATQASCDPQVVRAWRWATFGGIGLACGPSKVVLFDADGPEGVQTLARLTGGVRLATARAKTARGWHVLLAVPAGETVPTSSDPVTKLDVRSTGGFAVLAPSPHASGHVYSWEVAPWDIPIAECPPALLEYARAKKKRPAAGTSDRAQGVKREESKRSLGSGGTAVTLPDYLACATPDFGERLERVLHEPDWAEVVRALACIPANCSMDEWVRVGMALHQASNGSLQGLDVWDKWSATTKPRAGGEAGGEYREGECASSWSRWQIKADGVGLGSLFVIAAQHGYRREVMPTARNSALAGSEPTNNTETRPPDDVRAPGAVPPQAAADGGRQEGMNGHSQNVTEFFERLNASGKSIVLEDFLAFMPSHQYLFAPTGDLWPAASIDARFPPMQGFHGDGKPMLDKKGEEKWIPASKHLDRTRPVEQMAWMPGMPEVIRNRLLSDGGWTEREGVACANVYRAPQRVRGAPEKAVRWLDHVKLLYPEEWQHIVWWLAHRVQRPAEKINHALFLGGVPGVGKDTILEPAKYGVGSWNCQEISPQALLGQFNGYVRSVILRISEARDLGEVNRFQFYEHLKTLTAAPPDTLRCNEKHVAAYGVLNCSGVVITSNYKTDGIHIPADDRRHFVAWCPLKPADLPVGYFTSMWRWYETGGLADVATYLAELDISGFDPKAPPRKTQAFWDIVSANQAPEEAEIADLIDELGKPKVLTLQELQDKALMHTDIHLFLKDRKQRRTIPHRLEKCGYERINNPYATDGLWKINKARQAIYGRRDLTPRERLEAVRDQYKQ